MRLIIFAFAVVILGGTAFAGAARENINTQKGAIYADASPHATKTLAELQKSAPKNMAAIPEGEFMMGSREGIGQKDEHPRHKVYLDAFYIGKYEVTFGQYKDYAKAISDTHLSGNPETKRSPAGTHTEIDYAPTLENWSTDSHPVMNVAWADADAYCKWAGKRLPTEAEWEKAARGGTDTRYSFGNDAALLGDYAWYQINSEGQAHPVGRKKPNPYGLYDIHGNVGEWTSDWYSNSYYRDSPANDPKGPASGAYRVVRGGAWNIQADFLRAADRNWYGSDFKSPVTGFRCAVSAGEVIR